MATNSQGNPRSATHEQQLQELINATTDLTESVNVGKQALDSAVSESQTSASKAQSEANRAVTEADRSKAEANQAATSKNGAETAETNAEKAAADAAAVVYEGDASLTPAPGKIPIADSEGKIDKEWLPISGSVGVPEPDFHLPLVSDVTIRNGKGVPYQIDVSPAQDGSVMVDLPLFKGDFTRASKKTALDKFGFPREVPAGQAGFEPHGLLIEGGATNLIENSTITPNKPSLATSVEEVPFGDFKAYRCIGANGGDSQNVMNISRWSATGVAIGDVLTFSIWAKNNGDTQVDLRVFDGSSNGVKSIYCPANTGWRHYSGQVTVVSLSRRDTSFWPSKAGPYDYEVACPQVVKSTDVTSYIPTEGTPVTRNTDSLTVLTSEMGDLGNITVAFDFDSSLIAPRNSYVFGGNSHPYYFLFQWNYGGAGMVSFNFGRDKRIIVPGDVSGLNKVVAKVETVSGKGLRHTLMVNGRIKSYEFQPLTDNPNTLPKLLYVGGSGGKSGINGCIRNLRVWNRVLTDAQIANLEGQ